MPFLSVPEGQPRERVLTVGEMARLWDAAEQSHLRMFLLLLLGTAARPEAVLQLTRFQCDLERRLIDLNPPGRVQNKKRRPVVPMPDFLAPWIEAAGAGSGVLAATSEVPEGLDSRVTAMTAEVVAGGVLPAGTRSLN